MPSTPLPRRLRPVAGAGSAQPRRAGACRPASRPRLHRLRHGVPAGRRRGGGAAGRRRRHPRLVARRLPRARRRRRPAPARPGAARAGQTGGRPAARPGGRARPARPLERGHRDRRRRRTSPAPPPGSSPGASRCSSRWRCSPRACAGSRRPAAAAPRAGSAATSCCSCSSRPARGRHRAGRSAAGMTATVTTTVLGLPAHRPRSRAQARPRGVLARRAVRPRAAARRGGDPPGRRWTGAVAAGVDVVPGQRLLALRPRARHGAAWSARCPSASRGCELPPLRRATSRWRAARDGVACRWR